MAKKCKCFHCSKTRYWKRNYKVYLEDLKKKKGSEASTTSSFFDIEVNLSTSTSWVLDIGYGSHICINVHELKRSRTLTKGEVDL